VVPPFTGVAVKVTEAPVHEGLLPEVTAIETAASLEQEGMVKEKICVRAALLEEVPPMYSPVCQKVTPSGSSEV
jgi:hypothetical protein